jgi:hypothetical protein
MAVVCIMCNKTFDKLIHLVGKSRRPVMRFSEIACGSLLVNGIDSAQTEGCVLKHVPLRNRTKHLEKESRSL